MSCVVSVARCSFCCPLWFLCETCQCFLLGSVESFALVLGGHARWRDML